MHGSKDPTSYLVVRLAVCPSVHMSVEQADDVWQFHAFQLKFSVTEYVLYVAFFSGSPQIGGKKL